MKTEIWLIRHGETEWNRLGKIQGLEDIDLNEEGLLQAKKAAQALSDIYFTVILTSPLKRAFKTAEFIQAINKSAPPLVEDPNIVERNYGQLSGLSYAEKEKLVEAGGETGLESTEALNKRVLHVLDQIVTSYNGERIAVVSHGGFIKSMIIAASHGELERSDVRIRNCSISKLIHENGEWRIVGYNLTEHLEA